MDEARTLAQFITAYFVMDYFAGQPLNEKLETAGPLTEAACRAIFMPLLEGLEQVHGLGVVHRHIKPGNILLQDDGKPVLLDFGAARQSLGEHSQSLSVIATPGYAAYEQSFARGKR